MKISFKYACLLFALGLANNVWAICEAEYAVYRDAYQMMGYSAAGAETHTRAQKEADILSAQRLSAEDRQKAISEIQSMLKRAGIGKTASDRLYIAGSAKYLCVLDGTRSQNNFNQNTSNQQSQSPRQQSDLDQQIARQTAQQQSEQAQQSAQQSQSRADQQRQGKRKTNDPAAQAHECIAIDPASSGNYGAFKNVCEYKVNFYSCNYRPRTIQGGFNWSADFDCEKQKFGLYTPNGGKSEAAHNRNTEMVYWFACKSPATPVDAEFVVGKGIEARCHN